MSAQAIGRAGENEDDDRVADNLLVRTDGHCRTRVGDTVHDEKRSPGRQAFALTLLAVGLTVWTINGLVQTVASASLRSEAQAASSSGPGASQAQAWTASEAPPSAQSSLFVPAAAASAAAPKAGKGVRPPQAVEGGAAVYDYLYEKGGYHNSELSHEFLVVELARDNFPPSRECKLQGWCLSPHKTLTIGCSHGRGTAELHRAGYDASGMDVARKAVELATKRHASTCSEPPCFRQASLGDRLPFSDNAFDIGVSSDVLEHVPESSIDSAAAELSRIVKHLLVLRIANFLEMGKNGEKHGMGNLHITVHGSAWWIAKFAPYGWQTLADLPAGNYVFVVLGRPGDDAPPRTPEDAKATSNALNAWFRKARTRTMSKMWGR